MDILNNDVGYQLGLLAGGIWAQNYLDRGDQKRAAQAQNAIFDQTLQNWRDLRTQVGGQPDTSQAHPYSILRGKIQPAQQISPYLTR